MSDIEFSVLEAQQKIHELIAQHHPLEQTLDAIADWVSSMMPGALVSIMRFQPDTNSLQLMPGVRFSDDYFRAMQDIPVSENIGTCGTAAFTKQLVITDNIQKDTRWDGYHDKAMGVRVALDDFGTGYSSLSYLRELPVHKVKLDRSFVEKTATDHRFAAIVQGVITMAHHMDMIVVAEGIETREQQEDLARRHCDILQGYLFARPMPLAELKKLPDLLPVNIATGRG